VHFQKRSCKDGLQHVRCLQKGQEAHEMGVTVGKAATAVSTASVAQHHDHMQRSQHSDLSSVATCMAVLTFASRILEWAQQLRDHLQHHHILLRIVVSQSRRPCRSPVSPSGQCLTAKDPTQVCWLCSSRPCTDSDKPASASAIRAPVRLSVIPGIEEDFQ
jgi:hypothetical protein